MHIGFALGACGRRRITVHFRYERDDGAMSASSAYALACTFSHQASDEVDKEGCKGGDEVADLVQP